MTNSEWFLFELLVTFYNWNEELISLVTQPMVMLIIFMFLTQKWQRFYSYNDDLKAF